MSDQAVATRMPTAEADLIEVETLTKTFLRNKGEGTVTPIDDVTFTVRAGEMLVLLGPSGCGKTTLLRSIAGLETPDSGRIRIGTKVVFDAAAKVFVPPNKRAVGMIFQSYALWPHMSVSGNIAYPLKARGHTRDEIRERVATAAKRVGLEGLLRQYPGQLSGGQQQRVALARALVTDADVILFDEPLSNVDAKVREQLRSELVDMQRELGFTALYVTHDQAEAMELADRVAVLDQGRIAQLDPPRVVYQHPRSRYVADFIGTANILEGTAVELTDTAVTVKTGMGLVHAETPDQAWSGEPLNVGSSVYVMIRPEYLTFTSDVGSNENRWRSTIRRVTYAGTYSQYFVTIDDEPLRIWETTSEPLEEGMSPWVEVPRGRVRLLPFPSAGPGRERTDAAGA